MSIDTVYKNLPRSLQSAALTLYGYKQHRVRYGQQLTGIYQSEDLHAPLSYERQRELQQQRFAALIEHAATYVPHYRDLFARLGVTPRDITLENFRDILPLLTKAEIRAEPHRFHSTYFADKGIALFTSGTSGSPMPIQCSAEARVINYAFFRSMLRKHGSDVRERSATFAGRLLLGPTESAVFWRKDRFNKTLYLSSYHITDATLDKYVRALEEWDPQYIDSYPSAVALVADYINRHRIRHSMRLKFVLTSSETLSDHDRESISAAFGCKVVDHYGCTEMAVSAISDGGAPYEIDALYSLVEFLPVDSSDSHEVVCTGLINFAMPLIRYRIGDAVSGAVAQAEKPFFQQKFAAIDGRQDDLIVTPEGRKVGRMDPAFKGLSGISRAQIIQTTRSDIEVLVEAPQDANREQVTATLVTNIRERTSAAMNVSVRFVDAIPLTKAGKFKSVVSRVSN